MCGLPLCVLICALAFANPCALRSASQRLEPDAQPHRTCPLLLLCQNLAFALVAEFQPA